MKIKAAYFFVIPLIIILSAISGCDRPKTNSGIISEEISDTSVILIDYNNVVFCLPSPHRVTNYFIENNISFVEDLVLRATSNLNYETNFQKALHIGIYGTNQGYQVLFNHNNDSLALFLKVKELVNSLGLLEAINEESIKKIEDNKFDPDTILHFIANSYREVNSYAQTQNKKNLSVLIITGGWIESFYLLTEMQKLNKNSNLVHLIAEHKFALDNLIKVLAPYYETNQQFKVLTDVLIDLAYDLDAVEYEYNFTPSQTNADKMITVVKSTSNVVFDSEQLDSLNQKIRSIRNMVLFQQ